MNARKSKDGNPAILIGLSDYRLIMIQQDALIGALERHKLTDKKVTQLLGTESTQDGCISLLKNELVRNEERLSGILQIINRLEDERMKSVLMLRYVDGVSWDEVQKTMHYERTQIFEIHKTALQLLYTDETRDVAESEGRE